MEREQGRFSQALGMEMWDDGEGAVCGEADSLLPHCVVCGKVPPKGIMGGIFVRRQFICDCCEKEIVALDRSVLPEEKYLAVAGKLKRLWRLA